MSYFASNPGFNAYGSPSQFSGWDKARTAPAVETQAALINFSADAGWGHQDVYTPQTGFPTERPPMGMAINAAMGPPYGAGMGGGYYYDAYGNPAIGANVDAYGGYQQPSSNSQFRDYVNNIAGGASAIYRQAMATTGNNMAGGNNAGYPNGPQEAQTVVPVPIMENVAETEMTMSEDIDNSTTSEAETTDTTVTNATETTDDV